MNNESSKLASSWLIYKRLLSSARPYWFIFTIGVVGTLIASGADAGLSWLIKPLIDKGIVAKQRSFISWVPILIIGGFVIRSISLFVSNYCITRVGRSVVTDFRQKLFHHYLHLPASFYDKESSGNLLAMIVYNTEQLSSATTEASLTILQEGLMLIGLIAVMFAINWQLTLICMLTVPTLTIVIRYTTKRLRNLSSKVQKTIGSVTHIAEESIQGYRVIRTYGGENYELDKFNKATSRNRQCELKVAITNSLGTSIVQVMASLPLAFILYIATSPLLHISIGDFGAIVAAMARILTPMRRLTKINTEIQKGIAAANSIYEILEKPVENDNGIHNIGRAKGIIEYCKVQFKYPLANKEVLCEIDFKIKPNQTIALVGRSGSGKSTLASLLPRFYDVSSGEIHIDGRNINDYRLRDLRQQFALVSQHVTLFNDTIARNIAYGRFERADKREIMKAAEAAHLMDFIEQLPEGMDTLVGENGLLLSGGQRQRIAIARAIFKNAPILILDEATSSLDAEAENHIQKALDNLMRERTTLVIAHRLSTVERADKILVLDQGRIVESGTHKELLALNGRYAKFYNLQFKND